MGIDLLNKIYNTVYSLKGKRILLFIPNGKGNYGTAIYNELVKRGAYVDIYDERPSQRTITKAAFRIFKNKLEYYFIRYINNIIIQNQDKVFDIIFVIRAEAFTRASIELLKRHYPKAKYILYLWDSVKNTNTTSIFECFDRILSFDREDCEKYNLVFRPLFYIDKYKECSENKKRNIDLMFVGTIHSDRYCFIKKIDQIIPQNIYNTYYYFYIPSRLLYVKMKITKSCMRNASYKEFYFKPISTNEASNIMGRCKVSIDAQHPSQTGLTMRTIEALGARRKLITTNTDICNYDFYNKENILIVDRNKPQLNLEFIKAPFTEIPDNIYYKYSLQGWTDDIFQY